MVERLLNMKSNDAAEGKFTFVIKNIITNVFFGYESPWCNLLSALFLRLVQ
ncbi:hypothetical protein SAMN04488529_1334 [Clostridium gasigenes]|uniref:Uncharacterized protein n=1 Tax=Clostridium gasigenes TaxID=94869 RepID=A0A1H0W582_9CLOT|nr:hypothetical protein SAMN04488529_1334 [Clostridium gasigenes]